MGPCCGGVAPVVSGGGLPPVFRIVPGLRSRAAAAGAMGYQSSEGVSCGVGGCGPSCDCAPCRAAYRGAGGVAEYEDCRELGGTDCARLLGGEDESEDGDYATMDRDTWEGMTVAQRTAWLRSVARDDAERERLIAGAVRGGFDVLRGILSDRQATERERIRADADRRLAESRDRLAEERRRAEEARLERERLARGGYSITGGQSEGLMVAGGAALLFFLLSKR